MKDPQTDAIPAGSVCRTWPSLVRRAAHLIWFVAIACSVTPEGAPPLFGEPRAPSDSDQVQAAAPEPEPPGSVPDIIDPGPDFGFIPNSAQVVPPGRFYVETAFQSTQSDDRTVRNNLLPVLLRVGVIDGLELRALMNVLSNQRTPTGDSTGHGPLQLGFKYRFNKGEVGFLHPSFGFEGELVLPVASAGMDSGKVEPSATLNVDHFATESTVVTWNIGVFGPVDDTGQQFAQAFFGAAVTQWVADPLQLYVTGEARAPTSDAGGGSIGRVGAGLYWYLTKRIVFLAGYNWGLTSDSLDTDVVAGFTTAF